MDWSFTGSNNFVGITLRAMTSVNFQKFKNGVAYSYFILSEGNYYIASGSWTPPSKAYWYLVFINWDPDQQSTDVTLEYDLTELGDILALTLSSPLYLGRSYYLTWISSYDGLTEPNPNVKIDLYRGASYLSTIASSTSNDETYNWNVPLTLTPGTDYRIKISSTIRPSLVFDYSSYFEVAVFSEITQLSMSSSSLVMSQQVTIEWDYTYEGSMDPNPSVKIELYKGSSYVEIITSSTSNDGLYEWTVPDDVEPGATYRIKVSSVADPDNVYTWSDSFEIEEAYSLPDILPLLILLGIGVGGLLSILFLVRRRRKKVVPIEPPTPTVPSIPSVIQNTPPKKEPSFNIIHVLKVLYDDWEEKLTLEEISKEVGKETTILTTIDAAELKMLLDDLRQLKWIEEFLTDTKTKIKYQITHDGIRKWKSYTDPQELEALKVPQNEDFWDQFRVFPSKYETPNNHYDDYPSSYPFFDREEERIFGEMFVFWLLSSICLLIVGYLFYMPVIMIGSWFIAIFLSVIFVNIKGRMKK